MPLFGSLVATLFGNLFGFLTRYFVIEKAFKVAAAVVMIALVTLLFAALKSCAEGICSSALTSAASDFPTFSMGLGVVFNTTTYTAAACYMTVWTACQIYVLKKKLVSMITGL